MPKTYPFIQVVHDFDEGIKAYSFQPMGEDESTSLPEETPILAFGPIGKINIFVGATNAGKSRFLRSLAKCPEPNFIPEEEHRAMSQFLESCRWLSSQTEGSFQLTINQSNGSVLGGLPDWVGRVLSGLQPGRNYEINFDQSYFEQALEELDVYLDSVYAPTTNRVSYSVLASEFTQQGLWVKNLLMEEETAIEKDKESIARGQFGMQSFQSIKNRQSRWHLPALKFDFHNANETWKREFLAFWQSIDVLEKRRVITTQIIHIDQKGQRIYIPTLRSAVSLRDNQGKRLTYDIFEETVRRNYLLDDKDLEIFTGNRLYDTLDSDSRGSWEVQDRLHDFTKFLGEAFFEGRRVEIVALSEKYEEGQHISVRVQPDTPRQLHDLGDGINTLIILLYQLFMARPRSWVFIEEPELNLHPGLQRVFLQTLIENEALQARDLKVFFTTHSNHLLRMTLRDGTIASNDISVFAFQQRASDKDKFLVRPLVSEHHSALALLGVQNASVLLAQCGIWVEGVTDRQYLRAYLNAYQESVEFKKQRLATMREDTHFAFWEYAGSNLQHYLMTPVPRRGTPAFEEFDRGKKEIVAKIQSSALCNRIFLLADRDNKKEKWKHDPLEAISKVHDNFFYAITPCVEIENLLSVSQLTACLPKFLKGQPTIPTFEEVDYKNKHMGTFLRELFPSHCPQSWVAQSGTLETDRKNRLCELAVKEITWETMSHGAKRITQDLYKFLAHHNAV